VTWTALVNGLRPVAEQFLPDTATVRRATVTSGSGGVVLTWADYLTGVACRVSPLANQATEALGGTAGTTAVASWAITLPAGTDVTVKDRIVVNARTFEVARAGGRSYEVARRLVCREVT
jgi:hypothetical protein